MVIGSPSEHPKGKEPSLVLSGKNAKRLLSNLRTIQAKASRSRKIKWSNSHGKTTAKRSIASSKPQSSQFFMMKRYFSRLCIMAKIRLLSDHRPNPRQRYEGRPASTSPIEPCHSTSLGKPLRATWRPKSLVDRECAIIIATMDSWNPPPIGVNRRHWCR